MVAISYASHTFLLPGSSRVQVLASSRLKFPANRFLFLVFASCFQHPVILCFPQHASSFPLPLPKFFLLLHAFRFGCFFMFPAHWFFFFFLRTVTCFLLLSATFCFLLLVSCFLRYSLSALQMLPQKFQTTDRPCPATCPTHLIFILVSSLVLVF